jgi:hypothetical protein
MRLNSAGLLVLVVTVFFSGLYLNPRAVLALETGCDGPRAAISTLSDTGAGRVSLEPLIQQVVDLNNWPVPPYVPNDSRAGGIEMHVYTVTAELMSASLQPNGDLDLILAQPGDERWTLLAVLPDPARCALAASSPQATAMQTARGNITSTVGIPATGAPATPAIVRVTGAGFLNPSPGGRGEAVNGLELSPVIGFTLAGPAALRTFPILPPASASVSQSSPPAPPASAVSVASGSPVEAVATAVNPGPLSSPSTNPGPAPTVTPVSQQQISEALASSPPGRDELPPQFTSAALAAAGFGSGPASEYHLDFLLIDATTGQPGAVLKYAVYPTFDDANGAFAQLQSDFSQMGASSATQPYRTVCTLEADPSLGAQCAILIGPVVLSTQTADPAASLAIAQAGAVHLLNVIPPPAAATQPS